MHEPAVMLTVTSFQQSVNGGLFLDLSINVSTLVSFNYWGHQ